LDFYDWGKFDTHRETIRVRDSLELLIHSEDENHWGPALSYLEGCASDLGIPCSLTPALVDVFTSIVVSVGGRKRTEVLAVLEELTCGRGADEYSDAQRGWRSQAVREVALAFKSFVHIMATSSVEDAERCVDLLAYCAEEIPSLTERVRKYLARCEDRFPVLSEEIRAVSTYLEQHEIP
jgi:hypothetical protein